MGAREREREKGRYRETERERESVDCRSNAPTLQHILARFRNPGGQPSQDRFVNSSKSTSKL